MCISRNHSLPPSVVSLAASTFSDLFVDVQNSPMRGASFAREATKHSKKNRAHHVVTHNYHDHAHEEDDGAPDPVARGGVTVAFPIKLHEMLDQIEQDGYGHVVSWQPHGRCFVVHKPKEFVDHVMPTYFKQSKFPSFQRQLNLYGFQRLTKGPDKGGYYHELFLRGKVFLSHRIQRMRVKGTGVRARSNPAMEPNFYNMEPVVTSTPSTEGVCSVPYSTTTCTTTATVTPSLGPLEPTFNLLDETSSKLLDNDAIADFEGKEFYLLDPESCERYQPDEKVSEQEIQSFLDNLNISRELYDEITQTVDDDEVFGDLLQRMIE